MGKEFIIILFLLIIGLIIIFLLLKRRKEKTSSEVSMLQDQLKEIRQLLAIHQGNIQKQISESFKIIENVSEKLARLDDTNKQVISFAKQLQNLEDVLKNPKQRGVLGEYFLETVLKNVLPPEYYQMQYKFKDGEIVDAVIITKAGLIPVDSKFSLENYNRLLEEKDESKRKELERQFKQDLKNRIDETSKYIRPQERTTDFAFMFIPSEAIYYDLLVNKVGAVKANTRDLLEYAFREKRVIIVSPTTFFAYLQTVLQGFRALKIEESAREIRKRVEMLGKHIKVYDEYLRKLGSHLSTVVNTYNLAYKEFAKIDKDILKISGRKEEENIKPLELDKPSGE